MLRGFTGLNADKLCRTVMAILLLVMVGLNVANVIARHVLATSIRGADEILVFAMIWLVFAGAAIVAAQGRHLRFPVVYDRLPYPIRRVTGMGIAAGSVCLFGYAAFASWQVIGKLDRIGQTSMAAGIPMTVPHSAVFLCFALMALISGYVCIRFFTDEQKMHRPEQ